MLVRLIVIVIAIAMLFSVWLRVQPRGRKIINLAIWATVIVFALFPNTASNASYFFGIGENLNTLTFLGFVVVFILIQNISRTLERIQSKITRLVSNDALSTLTKRETPKDLSETDPYVK